MVVSVLWVPQCCASLNVLSSGTCNNHIGMGVRYNAEKKKIGNYYSTPIYSFRCKCHLCDGWFEIQTDPKVCLRCVCNVATTAEWWSRTPVMSWCQVHGRKMRSGTLQRTGASRYMVRTLSYLCYLLVSHDLCRRDGPKSGTCRPTRRARKVDRRSEPYEQRPSATH